MILVGIFVRILACAVNGTSAVGITGVILARVFANRNGLRAILAVTNVVTVVVCIGMTKSRQCQFFSGITHPTFRKSSCNHSASRRGTSGLFSLHNRDRGVFLGKLYCLNITAARTRSRTLANRILKVLVIDLPCINVHLVYRLIIIVMPQCIFEHVTALGAGLSSRTGSRSSGNVACTAITARTFIPIVPCAMVFRRAILHSTASAYLPMLIIVIPILGINMKLGSKGRRISNVSRNGCHFGIPTRKRVVMGSIKILSRILGDSRHDAILDRHRLIHVSVTVDIPTDDVASLAFAILCSISYCTGYCYNLLIPTDKRVRILSGGCLSRICGFSRHSTKSNLTALQLSSVFVHESDQVLVDSRVVGCSISYITRYCYNFFIPTAKGVSILRVSSHIGVTLKLRRCTVCIGFRSFLAVNDPGNGKRLHSLTCTRSIGIGVFLCCIHNRTTARMFFGVRTTVIIVLVYKSRISVVGRIPVNVLSGRGLSLSPSCSKRCSIGRRTHSGTGRSGRYFACNSCIHRCVHTASAFAMGSARLTVLRPCVAVRALLSVKRVYVRCHIVFATTVIALVVSIIAICVRALGHTTAVVAGVILRLSILMQACVPTLGTRSVTPFMVFRCNYRRITARISFSMLRSILSSPRCCAGMVRGINTQRFSTYSGLGNLIRLKHLGATIGLTSIILVITACLTGRCYSIVLFKVMSRIVPVGLPTFLADRLCHTGCLTTVAGLAYVALAVITYVIIIIAICVRALGHTTAVVAGVILRLSILMQACVPTLGTRSVTPFMVFRCNYRRITARISFSMLRSILSSPRCCAGMVRGINTQRFSTYSGLGNLIRLKHLGATIGLTSIILVITACLTGRCYSIVLFKVMSRIVPVGLPTFLADRLCHTGCLTTVAGLAYVALAVITYVIIIIAICVRAHGFSTLVAVMIPIFVFTVQRSHICTAMVAFMIAITLFIVASTPLLSASITFVIFLKDIGVLGSSSYLFNLAFFALLPMVIAIIRPFKRGTCMLFLNGLSAHVARPVSNTVLSGSIHTFTIVN